MYAINDTVWIHAFGNFYPGLVTKLGRKNITVEYGITAKRWVGKPQQELTTIEYSKTVSPSSWLVCPRSEGQQAPRGTRQGFNPFEGDARS